MTTKEKVEEILNYLKGHFIYAYLGGSKMIEYIQYPSDYDIIIVCKDQADRSVCLNLCKDYNREDLRSNYGIDLHIKTPEYQIEHLYFRLYKHDFLAGDEVYEALKIYIPEILSIDEFLNQEKTIKTLYKNLTNKLITNQFKSKKSQGSDNKYRYKHWYNIYLNLCILNNRSPVLTEEQISNLNILHDRREEDLEKRKELINNIIEDIKSW